MILERVCPGGRWYFMSPDGEYVLRTHKDIYCYDEYCAVHNPSDNVMSSFPYNWREELGIMERICPHGVGHPDLDGAAYLLSIGEGYKNVHGCCSEVCCG